MCILFEAFTSIIVHRCTQKYLAPHKFLILHTFHRKDKKSLQMNYHGKYYLSQYTKDNFWVYETWCQILYFFKWNFLSSIFILFWDLIKTVFFFSYCPMPSISTNKRYTVQSYKAKKWSNLEPFRYIELLRIIYLFF